MTTCSLSELLASSTLVAADGGLETTLVFHDGLDLADFAAFPLLDSADGRDHLRRYYTSYLDAAVHAGVPMLLDTPTWRANPDWGARLGYGTEALGAVNRDAVAFMTTIAATRPGVRTAINGVIGPRGDGYRVDTSMTPLEAARYHAVQAEAFAAAGADAVTAVTMTHAGEAAGIALAARDVGLPAIISFTVETDGLLPSGEALGEAITGVDHMTAASPTFYMVNCAHPTHLAPALDGEAWSQRIGGIRANASRASHAELDAADTLDSGDPEELAQDYRRLRARLPGLRLVGGCCGTDHRHVESILDALLR